MHLKKLELHGFKSFADKTEVLFDQGVTCVVGPNGCGKSNISDSIRWVLGERSAKLLRGSKMEDVIFSGTDYRKPLSYAEVSLTFDNEDRGLPIDYSEVTIARRLYRSGQSEYYINKTLVRLKDIHDLILDTGIGSNSYSMIEQGRIDYILNADPDERRFLIEEAAGISKYKVKKEEAIRKLERTEQNVLRLNDIVHEVEKNIQYAERQAKRAEKYKEKFERLKNLEIRKAFRELTRLGTEKTSIDTWRQEKQSALDGLEHRKTESKKQLTEQQLELERILAQQSEKEAKRFGLITTREKNEQQLQFNREKRTELATRKGEISQERLQLEGRLKKNSEEIRTKEEEIQRLLTERGKIGEQVASQEALLAAAQESWKSVKDQFEKEKTKAYEIAAEMTRTRNDYHRMMAFLESSHRHKNKMSGNLDRFSKEQKDWERKKQEYTVRIAELEQKIGELTREEESLNCQISEIETEIEKVRARIRDTERNIHEKQSKLVMLKELDAGMGISKQTLVNALPELGQDILHGIREILTVKEGYEKAVEAALGAYAESVLVENEEAGKKLIQYLSGQKTSGFHLWIKQQRDSETTVESAPAAPEVPGCICRLSEAVEIKSGYESLLKPLLNRTFFVEKIETGDLTPFFNASREIRFVTPEGICFGSDGHIYFRLGLSGEQNVFQRGHEIEALNREIDHLTASLNQFNHEVANKIEDRDQQEKGLQSHQNHLMEQKIQKESFQSLKGGLEDRLASHGREAQLVMQDILELNDQRQDVEARKEKLEKTLEELVAREKQQMEYESGLLKEIEEREKEKTEIFKVLADRRARAEHFDEQIALLRESLAFMADSDKLDRERIQALQEEARRGQEKLIELDEWDVRIDQELKALETETRETDVFLEMIRQEKNKTENNSKALEKEIQELVEKQHAVEKELHESEMKTMDVGYQERLLHEKMEQTYHISLKVLNSEEFPWEDRSPEEVDAEIAALREKVDQIGTVNLLAIEEYDELKKRYDFLMGQKKDLEDSRNELLEAIRKINRTTKSLFEETFARVQATFKEYYQTLFRGGDARLILVDEAHPLESGIDIMVRPPGKKNQHISLLSGGEKALTAIALLFAIFKIKPSPYSVLDEVDAPLDEANIDRFLTVLRTFLDSTQFIIITHNRKTIAMGDSLYGVTMQEAGVSKIVSVKVTSNEILAGESKKEADRDTVENSVSA